jgi:molecular chaperone GrpE
MAQNTNAVQQIAMLKAELDRAQAAAAANLEGWQRTYAELQRSEADAAAFADSLQQARTDVENARTEADQSIVRARKLDAELSALKASGGVDTKSLAELQKVQSELAEAKTELEKLTSEAAAQEAASAVLKAELEALKAAPPVVAGLTPELQAELDKAKAEAASNLDGWQRTRAEFANFKKRTEANSGEIRQFATTGLIGKLLPVQDDFERAIKNLPENLKSEVWVEGVLLISRKIGLVFESESVKPLDVKKGDVFDPAFHEAITHDEDAEVASGHVIEELQRGYKIGERVLRPALVRVAK